MKKPAGNNPGSVPKHPVKYFRDGNILILFIVFAGAFLRLYMYFEAPLTYDEFSALFRTGYGTFNELIAKGVKTSDMHPAAVQVFLFYWVKLFGNEAYVLKLPFVIFGIVSIYLVYKTGEMWFNKTTGLFAALFIAFLQYPITYSLYARPYAIGMFFSLMMVFFWTKALFSDNNRFIHYAGFTLFAVLCALNHYFSMMFAMITGISGLFLVKRKKLLPYLISGLVIVVAFLPHIEITLYQFSRKGVGSWLGKPSPGFYLNYMKYIFHYSGWMYALVLAITLTGLFVFPSGKRKAWRFRFLALIWIAVPAITGYLYSIWVNPVLQYSVLIFVFPFIFIFLFSFWKEVSFPVQVSVTVITAFISITTLVFHREHYIHSYESGYRNILNVTHETQSRYGKENVTVFIRYPENILNYYTEKGFEIDMEKVRYFSQSTSVSEFRDSVRGSDTQYAAYGWAVPVDPVYLGLIREEFPYLVEKHAWYLSEYYLFSKNKPDETGSRLLSDTVYFSCQDYDSEVAGWQPVTGHLMLNKTGEGRGMSLFQDSTTQYAPGFRFSLDEIIDNENNYIFISVEIKPLKDKANIHLVAALTSGENTVEWKSSILSDHLTDPEGWNTIHLAINLPDIRQAPGLVFHTYLWNKGQTAYLADNYQIFTAKGNPVVYSLFEDY
ncbi:MAG: glycosyltransferase family 39 protein [Bacteroidales bacterium]|nr:glycosyltransferase family 39 protein [Bacteroidales bacterium]